MMTRLSSFETLASQAPQDEVSDSILRLGQRFARGVDAKPAGGRKPLLRQEAALVVHLLRAFDPVGGIDVRPSPASGAGAGVEEHEGAGGAAFLLGVEEQK